MFFQIPHNYCLVDVVLSNFESIFTDFWHAQPYNNQQKIDYLHYSVVTDKAVTYVHFDSTLNSTW